VPGIPGQGDATPADRDDPLGRRKQEIEAEVAAHDFVARAAIKEPSAKERARRPGWLSRRRAAARAGRARRRMLGKWSWRADGVVTVLVIAAVATGLAFIRVHDHPVGDRAPVTNGPVPSASVAAGTPAAVSIARPFAGSPAAGYADGAAGIITPRARPVGHYSAASVAAAYSAVRKLLVAAYLDPQTLRGGSPDAFTRLLIPQQRTVFVRNLGKLGVDSHGDPLSSRDEVVSFAPGTQIVGSVIKVHGTMWAQQASENGQPALRIRTSYVFVYPVERPGDQATLIRVVPHSYAAVDFGTWDDPGGALEPWLYDWPGDGTANARCDVSDGFVHPAFGNGPPQTVAPSGPPKNPYSLASPSRYRCRRITGT
jgi:hypothetical protein